MTTKKARFLRRGSKDGLVYDRRLYNTYSEAWNDTRKNDTMLVCKYDSVYFADNFAGWQVEDGGIIREVTR